MINPSASSSQDYQKEVHKLRIKRLIDILQGQGMANEENFAFFDNFVKTYCPDASKNLKNSLTPAALKKVYAGTQYKDLETGQLIFSAKESLKYYVLVISGKVNIREESEEPKPALKTYAKGEVITAADIQGLSQAHNLEAVAAEKTEVLMYEKALYDSNLQEMASNANNMKLRGISKNFLKIKKMDRGSKEEYLSYFKTEKFTKGTVMVNIKSKIEEIYMIQSGKVVLCVDNGGLLPSYPNNKIAIGVLGPETLLNEWTLLFEKQSPYYAVCMEDTEVLSVNKANLNFVADADTLSDLRANCQCKQRLQSSFLEKYATMSAADIEKSQNKIIEKANIKLKDILDVFQKFDPKSKNSVQFAKNLAKFNMSVGKPEDGLKKLSTGPMQKFSEFATPRLVSKDPNFKNLNPQRQLALLALRNEGANRRSGNTGVSTNAKEMNKDEIMKMQSRLLNEEKEECQRLVQKKTISDRLNINKLEEQKSESSSTGGVGEKKELFNKFKMGNDQLLANFKFGVGIAKEETKEKDPTPTNKESTPTNKESAPVQEEKSANPPTDQAAQEVKPVEVGAPKASRENLANLLGVGIGVGMKPMIRPQTDMVNKKRTNLLKNINLL